MGIAADWTINYTARTITHTSGTTVYNVFDESGSRESFYWWLQDTFDELANLDDPVPIKKNSPTSFDFINRGYLPAGDGGCADACQRDP